MSHNEAMNDVKWSALLPAAGVGSRLGLGPKAAVKIAGRSLLSWSVEALRPHVHEVIVALGEGQHLPDDVENVAVVQGGASRQASVHALVKAAQHPWLLVHDAARPFLPAACVERLQAAVLDASAATLALPPSDALVLAGEDPTSSKAFWIDSVPRESIWRVQTPQAFAATLLAYAHAAAESDGHEAADDAALVARLGHSVQLVPGDGRLLKVTHPQDVALAELLLKGEA